MGRRFAGSRLYVCPPFRCACDGTPLRGLTAVFLLHAEMPDRANPSGFERASLSHQLAKLRSIVRFTHGEQTTRAISPRSSDPLRHRRGPWRERGLGGSFEGQLICVGFPDALDAQKSRPLQQRVNEFPIRLALLEHPSLTRSAASGCVIERVPAMSRVHGFEIHMLSSQTTAHAAKVCRSVLPATTCWRSYRLAGNGGG